MRKEPSSRKNLMVIFLARSNPSLRGKLKMWHKDLKLKCLGLANTTMQCQYLTRVPLKSTTINRVLLLNTLLMDLPVSRTAQATSLRCPYLLSLQDSWHLLWIWLLSKAQTTRTIGSNQLTDSRWADWSTILLRLVLRLISQRTSKLTKSQW